MADNNTKLDDLQIDIVVNATKAESALSKLASSLRGLGRSSGGAKTASSNVKDLGNASASSETKLKKLSKELDKTKSELEKTKSSLKKLKDQMKNTGDATHKATGRFQNFIHSIGRIAMYRAIRSGIRAVTQAVSEGFSMFVNWDRESNNSMQGIAANVDRITEKWTILKGQLGAAAGALINAFAPAITWIIDGLTKIVDVFQMVIQSLRGEYEYYKLIYKEASATTSAAKELKRVLFGFDELNVLPGTSGGGVTSPTGKWEYEPQPISNKFLNSIADASNKLKEFFGWGEEGQDIFAGLASVLGVLIGGKALGGLLGLIPRLLSGLGQKNTALADETAQTQADASAAKSLATNLGLILGGATLLSKFLKENPLNLQIAQPEIDFADLYQQIADAQTELNKSDNKLKVTVNAETSTASSKILSFMQKYKESRTWLVNNPAKATVSADTKEPTSKLVSFLHLFSNSKTWLINNPATATVKADTSEAASALSALDTATKTPFSISTVISANVEGMISTLTNVISTLQANVTPIVIPVIESTVSDTSSLASGLNGTATGVTAKESSMLNRFNSLLPTFKDQLDALGVSVPKPLYSSMWTYSQNTGAINLANWLKDTASNIPMNPAFSNVTSINAFLTQLMKLLPALALAGGGTVPNTGTLFYAGENHGAEVVADMGSHTGVMNVSQMQEAVAAGNVEVINAIYGMANMMVKAFNDKSFDIYMDSAKVGKSVTAYQNNQARRGIAQGAY